MPEINREWVVEQLEAAKVKVGSGKAILKLLEAWAEIPKLSDNMTEEVLTVFPQLAQGHVLKIEENDDDYIWMDAQPGQITVGDIVRVKTNAFEDNLGTIHNGRRGKVVAIRYGDVIFKADDGKTPPLDGVHYSPYKLEKRYRKS